MQLNITELVALRVEAKEREDAAIAHRREIDAAIVDAVGQVPEGTKSQDIDGWKVSVTFKLDRKLDTERLQSTWGAISPSAQNAVKWKADLSVSEYRKLNDDDRKSIDQFVTTKPASPSIKVEAISREQ